MSTEDLRRPRGHNAAAALRMAGGVLGSDTAQKIEAVSSLSEVSPTMAVQLCLGYPKFNYCILISKRIFP